MKPTVGRIVHYLSLGDKDGKYPSKTIAAMVTDLNEDGTVALKAFYPTGFFDMPRVEFSEIPERGKWSWPPKV